MLDVESGLTRNSKASGGFLNSVPTVAPLDTEEEELPELPRVKDIEPSVIIPGTDVFIGAPRRVESITPLVPPGVTSLPVV